MYTLATKNIKSGVRYLEQVHFSNTHELWSSKADWCLRFLLLSIMLVDLLGKRTLHKQVQKVMVCDLWLVDFNPFCRFVCCTICCLWSLLWLPAAKNAIVKVWPLNFRVCVFVKSAVNWAHATVQAYSVWLYVIVQGAPKPMSDCPGQVEIQFGQVNLWHNLSMGQAHF